MAYQSIPLSDIKPPLVPVRRVADDDKMRELILSIARDGLLHPLVVVPEDGQYRILAGHRRYIAITSLNWDEVDCHVLDGENDDQEYLTVTENLVREDMSDLDLGWYLRHLVEDKGMIQTEIGQKYDHSQAWVSRHIKLTTLPDDMQQDIEQQRLNSATALELSRINDEESRRQYTNQVIARGSSITETRRYVNAYKKHEATIEQAVHIANEVRQEQAEEVNPTCCVWCGREASRFSGEMVFLCAGCINALQQSKEQNVAETPQEGG